MRAYPTLLLLALLSPARAEPSRSKEIYRWKGPPSGAVRLHLRNVNGPVKVRAAAGPDLEVSARATARNGAHPDALTVLRKAAGADLAFCVVRSDRAALCEADGRFDADHGAVEDVEVTIEVAVPRGTSVDVRTVNGAVDARDLSGTVSLETVNGSIGIQGGGGKTRLRSANGSVEARVASGELEAETANGRIDVTLGAQVAEARLGTVNGDLTLVRPAQTGLELEAATVHGQVTIDGRPSGQVHRGRVGPAGGARVRAAAVNGSIDVVAR